MKWFSVHVGGQKWRVDLVKGNHRALKQDGQACNGYTAYEDCKIYIGREESEQAREDTLLHELLHAAFYVSRGHHTIHEVCEDEELGAKTEEKIIEGLVLVLHPMLKELGFKFPRASNGKTEQ
jgi:hypothetical protein